MHQAVILPLPPSSADETPRSAMSSSSSVRRRFDAHLPKYGAMWRMMASSSSPPGPGRPPPPPPPGGSGEESSDPPPSNDDDDYNNEKENCVPNVAVAASPSPSSGRAEKPEFVPSLLPAILNGERVTLTVARDPYCCDALGCVGGCAEPVLEEMEEDEGSVDDDGRGGRGGGTNDGIDSDRDGGSPDAEDDGSDESSAAGHADASSDSSDGTTVAFDLSFMLGDVDDGAGAAAGEEDVNLTHMENVSGFGSLGGDVDGESSAGKENADLTHIENVSGLGSLDGDVDDRRSAGLENADLTHRENVSGFGSLGGDVDGGSSAGKENADLTHRENVSGFGSLGGDVDGGSSAGKENADLTHIENMSGFDSLDGDVDGGSSAGKENADLTHIENVSGFGCLDGDVDGDCSVGKDRAGANVSSFGDDVICVDSWPAPSEERREGGRPASTERVKEHCSDPVEVHASSPVQRSPPSIDASPAIMSDAGHEDVSDGGDRRRNVQFEGESGSGEEAEWVESSFGDDVICSPAPSEGRGEGGSPASTERVKEACSDRVDVHASSPVQRSPPSIDSSPAIMSDAGRDAVPDGGNRRRNVQFEGEGSSDEEAEWAESSFGDDVISSPAPGEAGGEGGGPASTERVKEACGDPVEVHGSSPVQRSPPSMDALANMSDAGRDTVSDGGNRRRNVQFESEGSSDEEAEWVESSSSDEESDQSSRADRSFDVIIVSDNDDLESIEESAAEEDSWGGSEDDEASVTLIDIADDTDGDCSETSDESDDVVVLSEDDENFSSGKNTSSIMRSPEERPRRSNQYSNLYDGTPKTPHTSAAAFRRRRDELTAIAYEEFTTVAFEGSMGTSEVDVTWSKRLQTTAGITRLRKIGDKKSGSFERRASIELSTKVIDNVRRLRATLLHEMCHAAAWLLDGTHKPAHGPCFQKWARYAMARIKDVEVTTTHDYEITYKYAWACTTKHCGAIIQRHSRSVDVNRQCCSSCRGKLIEIEVPGSKKDISKVGHTPKKKRQPSGFSLFVQKHSKEVRRRLKSEQSHGGSVSQADVWKECSRLWQEEKSKGGNSTKTRLPNVEEDNGIEKESMMDSLEGRLKVMSVSKN